MIPPRKHHQEENVDSWLMSYADMITLLLCFFVIFVSISEPKKERLEAVTEGIIGKFGLIETATPFQGVFRSLQEIIETRQILRDIAIEKGETSLSIELSSIAFYKDKTAELAPDMIEVMKEVVATLKKIDFMEYRISIEGHTNDLPPEQRQLYASNWELSSARAARLARFFIEQGIDAKRIKIVGYGDSRPKVPNLDINGNAIMENRRKNERVVIRLERVL